MTIHSVVIIGDAYETAKAHAAILSLRGLRVSVTDWKAVDVKSADGVHLVLLDANDHDADWLTMCRQVRSRFHVPLLLMTYASNERYLLEAYRLGVDECIIKPLGVELLCAKVHAWLRRTEGVQNSRTNVVKNGFYLNLDRRTITTPAGSYVRLSRLEFELAYLFFSNSGRILETDFILNRVWANTDEGDAELVKNLVYRLRRKIEPDPQHPQYLQTIPGQGYVFSSR